jgi:hypothetical protein
MEYCETKLSEYKINTEKELKDLMLQFFKGLEYVKFIFNINKKKNRFIQKK